MIRPTDSLERHPFAILSRSLDNAVSVLYDFAARFDFPAPARPLLAAPEAYWKERSPQLVDADSIVHVWQVEIRKSAITLKYSPTTFFKFLWLNCSLDVPLVSGVTLRCMYDEGVFGTFTEHVISTSASWFQFPQFGNSLGITVVLLTADNFLIAARRSETSAAITTNKGDWQCAVGTQVKRHQRRFADADGLARPYRCAWEGLLDEQGAVVYRSISERPICRGLVYRLDLHHCEIVYEFRTGLEAPDVLHLWSEKKGTASDASEIALRPDGSYDIRAIDVSRPEPLLACLTGDECWAPQHAAGALLCLAARFPKAVCAAGLDVRPLVGATAYNL